MGLHTDVASLAGALCPWFVDPHPQGPTDLQHLNSLLQPGDGFGVWFAQRGLGEYFVPGGTGAHFLLPVGLAFLAFFLSLNGLQVEGFGSLSLLFLGQG